MINKTFVVIGVACLALSGCIIVDSDEDVHDKYRYHAETQFGLEPLKAVNIGASDVTVRLASGGCTSKSTVEASVDKDGRKEYEIAVERLTEDSCKAYMPDGVALTWTYAELDIPAGSYVRVLNKVKN